MSVTRHRTATRTFRRLTERPTGFEQLRGEARRHVGALLDQLDPALERVYLLGARPGRSAEGARRWAAGPYPDGWEVHPRGHYLEGEHPVLRFVRPDGRPLELLRAAVYMGPGTYGVREAREAWYLLRRELAARFPAARGEDAPPLLSSPAATGRELWLRSIPRGVEWPVLADDVQQLIRSTSGQGRVQLFDQPGPLPELVGYDGRLMYAALCRGLPGPGGRLVRCREYLGYTRARYSGFVRVPPDWDRACQCGAPGHPGLGLLGRMADDPRDGWEWPAEPGRRFAGWWDGAELQIALAHGWTFEPQAAVVFPDYKGRGPLDTWAERLIAVRRRLEPEPGSPDRPALELARNAVRSILLHSVGAFHGAAHRHTRAVPLEQADQVPADARDVRVEGDHVLWGEWGGQGWPELAHPEWSTAVWARARTRLLTCPTGTEGERAGALHVPAGELVGFRTDAVYLARDPGWADDGRPGRLRRTITRAGPLEAPHTHAELLELARGVG